MAVKAGNTAHRAEAAPETRPSASGKGRHSVLRYRTGPGTLRELAIEAGRKQLYQLTWHHGTTAPRLPTRTGPWRCDPGSCPSGAVRPTDTPPLPGDVDGAAPEVWMIAEWPPHEPEPTDY